MQRVHWSFSDKPSKSLVIYIDNKQKTLAGDDPQFENVFTALKEGKSPEEILELIDISERINSHCAGSFEVRDGVVYVGNEALPDALSDKVILFTNEQIDVEPLLCFWNNLSQNPSFNSRKQLYCFMEHNHVPIVNHGEVLTFKTHSGATIDVDCSGFIVCWKAIRNNFMDHHSGKFNNTPGNVVSMPRKLVNDNQNETCSNGLHVAAWEYAQNFMSGKFIKVYVNPKDVVSVPTDYNRQKMRVCKYFVVSEVEDLEGPKREERDIVHSSRSFVSDELDSDDSDEDYYDDDYDDGYYDDVDDNV